MEITTSALPERILYLCACVAWAAKGDLEYLETTIPQAVVDGYKSVYTNKLQSISGADIHFWYGTKEAFVAKPQVKHLLSLCPQAHIEVFQGMNHGQLLIDRPEEIAQRITKLLIQAAHKQ